MQYLQSVASKNTTLKENCFALYFHTQSTVNRNSSCRFSFATFPQHRSTFMVFLALPHSLFHLFVDPSEWTDLIITRTQYILYTQPIHIRAREMHKGSGWGLICIYAKPRMRFDHWQIFGIRAAFHESAAQLSRIQFRRSGLNRAISCACLALFAGSLRERCTRRLGPAPILIGIRFNGRLKKDWEKDTLARTHARGRDLRGCESIRTEKEREKERKIWGREGGGREADLF